MNELEEGWSRINRIVLTRRPQDRKELSTVEKVKESTCDEKRVRQGE